MENFKPKLNKYVNLRISVIKKKYKKSTAAGYLSCLTVVTKELEARDLQLEDLKHSDIVAIILDWQDKVKNKTIVNRLTQLRALTLLAHKDGYLTKDPCEDLESVEIDILTEEAKPFTKADFIAMENTPTLMPSAKSLALIERVLGARIQEAIALCWSDIDFENRKIRIRRTCTKGAYSTTKNKHSDRVIDMSLDAFILLLEQFKITGNNEPIFIEIQDKSNVKHKVHAFKPVFVDDKTGAPFNDSKDYSQRFFSKFLEDAELEHRGPSQLRHSFASIALSNGVPIKLISVMMGHASTAVTEAHYAKWLPISDEDTRAQLDSALSLDSNPQLCEITKAPDKSKFSYFRWLMIIIKTVGFTHPPKPSTKPSGAGYVTQKL